MPRINFTLPLILITLSAITPAQAEHYKVYFLGGQSNGNGRGNAAELTGALAAPQTDVRFYWHRTQATNNVGHLAENMWIDLEPGSGHGTTTPAYPKEFGSEISFGRAMADADSSTNIAIIKYTHGGTNLHTQWAAGGPRYASFLNTVKAGLAALTAAGDTYELAGMIWHQGESDTGRANAYEANLTNLIKRIRDDVFGGQTRPFIIAGLSNSQNSSISTPGSDWYILRQAQEAVAAKDDSVGFVNTDGYTTRPGDTIHLDHAGQIALGNGFAAEMVRIEPLLEIDDADGDGLSAEEEAEIGTNPVEPDSDFDGQNDGLESNAGTDPLDGGSMFAIAEASKASDGVSMTWPSKLGNEYTVEGSTDLSTWSVLVSDLPATAGATTTWTGSLSLTDSSVIASYGAPTALNGNFDTASFDSLDSNPGSVASRLEQGGSLTGGGSSSYVLSNALFDSSESGSPGFNLAGVNTSTRGAAESAGDSFNFTVQPTGEPVTYESLTFYCDQFGTTAKVDVSYAIDGTETFVLEDFSPPGSNAPVQQHTIDFPNFSTSLNVIWSFYLYGASGNTHGTRFDDITLLGLDVAPEPFSRCFYRVRLQ